jgi:hypothetical protein
VKRVMLALWATVFTVGCGTQSYIELAIDDELAEGGVYLAVGATDTGDDVETDELRFDLFRDEAGDDLITSKPFALDASHSFPLTAVMEPVDDTPNPVSVHVLALRDGAVVAAAGVAIDWQEGVVSLVPVQLRRVP